jgi:hypothetical protein
MRHRCKIFRLHRGRQNLDHLSPLDPQFDHSEHAAPLAVFRGPVLSAGDRKDGVTVQGGCDRAVGRREAIRAGRLAVSVGVASRLAKDGSLRLYFDGRAAVVARMRDPASFRDRRERASRAVPQLRNDLGDQLRIIGGNRHVEQHEILQLAVPSR